MKKIVCIIVLSLISVLGCEQECDELIPDELMPLLGSWSMIEENSRVDTGSSFEQDIFFDSCKKVKLFNYCDIKLINNEFLTAVYGESSVYGETDNIYVKCYGMLTSPDSGYEYKYFMTKIERYGERFRSQSLHYFDFIDDTHIEGVFTGCSGSSDWGGTFSGQKVD